MALKRADELDSEEQPKSGLNIGDILPISQVVGYNVIKEFKDGKPIVVQTEKFAEAEILSFIYKDNART